MSATDCAPGDLCTTELEDFMRSARRPATDLARRLTRSRTDADDVVAEAMANLWRRSRHVEIAHPWTYLTRSIHNEVVDRARKANREHRALTRHGARPFDEDVVSFDDLDELLPALGTLRPPERQVITLRYAAGLSTREVAEQLGVPDATVKSLARRGLLKLRRELRSA